MKMGAMSQAGVRVIKIGGRPQSDERIASLLGAAWRSDAGALIVVHGGGDEVTALQRVMNTEPRFVGGRRVTSAADIDILRMGLSGVANKRLVARLRAAGVPAVGLSGEDGGLVEAHTLDEDTLGCVGVPVRIGTDLLHTLLSAGYLPVVSPLAASDAPGEALNVNGDDAAAAIAGAMRARELLLVADVAGVLVEGVAVSSLDRAEAERLLAEGVASAGMKAKVQAALAALEHGVSCVRIGDVAAIDDESRGTRFIPAALPTAQSPLPRSFR